MHSTIPVRTGLDVVVRDGHPLLESGRIGLVTNHTAVTHDLRSIVDVLHADDRFTLAQLFAPEHGVRGSAQAGTHVGDERDPATGLPVVSLYGANRAPTPDHIAGLDVLLFDMQDAGARHYTYMSTMVHVMDVCATLDLPFVVLDRPNPITGVHTEGKVLDPDYTSFVGIHPMPTRHGLTIGELALMIAAEQNKPAPTVVPCEGWSRELWWDDTDLPFVMPSPNLPTLDSLTCYTATCIFEATPCSEGRGTTRPFELVGAPWIDADELARDLNSRNLPGVRFRATGFTPSFSKHEGELCGGVQLHIHDREAFRPVATGIHVIHAFKHHPNSQFEWRPGPVGGMSADRLYGNDELHKMIDAGAAPEEVVATWEPEVSEFVERSRAFHLYP